MGLGVGLGVGFVFALSETFFGRDFRCGFSGFSGFCGFCGGVIEGVGGGITEGGGGGITEGGGGGGVVLMRALLLVSSIVSSLMHAMSV